MKTVLVCGAGGFIGSHLVTALKRQGHRVIGVDSKFSEYTATDADFFHLVDLRDWQQVRSLTAYAFDEIYQLAADMGGAGYIFTGEHDAEIMSNSARINLNVAELVLLAKNRPQVFFASSACVYPRQIQQADSAGILSEHLAYPADPDSDYGWEKLFSERLWQAKARNYGFEIRIARLHNVFGPYSHFSNKLAKFPGALCYKVATATRSVDIWGDGQQVRSFLFVDECIKGIQLLMQSTYNQPINLGSDRAVSIEQLTRMAIDLSGKSLTINYVPGPVGVSTRNSDNRTIRSVLGWQPENNLEHGIKCTYDWIVQELENVKSN